MKASTPPAVLEFVVTKARDRQAEALAGNPELIRQQMDQHAEVVSSMRTEFGKKVSDLEKTIHNVRAKLSAVTVDRDHERKLRRELQRLLENAVIPDPKRPGELTTLWSIVESAEYRVRCRNCQTLECEGCFAEVIQ